LLFGEIAKNPGVPLPVLICELTTIPFAVESPKDMN